MGGRRFATRPRWWARQQQPHHFCLVHKNNCAAAPFSTHSHHNASTTITSGERLRVAIVGGGAAGLSTGLHLAPLVQQGLLASPIDIYEASSSRLGREIGVGLWSTALVPFHDASSRESHQMLWQDLNHHGRWVGQVGYRTPRGAWLAKSELPTGEEEDRTSRDLPALLFLREMDMLTALSRAAHLEELKTTLKIHRGGQESDVRGLWEESPQPYSAPLLTGSGEPTERDYHLIVAAEGMNSTLRKQYGGHRKLQRLTGTNALVQREFSDGAPQEAWEGTEGQTEANAIEDRGYTVFRGNANLSVEEAGMNGVSFQTWGVGKSMRFATVPLSYPSDTESKRTEKQVWFITTSDDAIVSEQDAIRRHEMLRSAFADWHDPIPRMIEATPPDEILFERGMAHKHSVAPVLNVNKILKRIRKRQSPASGPGPALVFVGDSFMTVDPILAQGFTMAMESAHELAGSLRQACQTGSDEPMLAFDPYALRKELMERHVRRSGRLLGLLRATEIVQALGQPQSGVVGAMSRRVIRPLMQITPDLIKRPMFNYMLKYSLGLSSRR